MELWVLEKIRKFVCFFLSSEFFEKILLIGICFYDFVLASKQLLNGVWQLKIVLIENHKKIKTKILFGNQLDSNSHPSDPESGALSNVATGAADNGGYLRIFGFFTSAH